MGMALLHCCAAHGENRDTPNQVFLDNRSPVTVIFRCSVGDIALSPRKSQVVIVQYKSENIKVLDIDYNTIDTITVHADSLKFCHPDSICVTEGGQIVTEKVLPAPHHSTNREEEGLLNA